MNDLTLQSRIGTHLKVWWLPQVPMRSFNILLNSFAEAKVLLESLAQYDLFRLKHNVNPDFCNSGGLLVFNDGDWLDWESEDWQDIFAVSHEQCVEMDRKFYNDALEAATKEKP